MKRLMTIIAAACFITLAMDASAQNNPKQTPTAAPKEKSEVKSPKQQGQQSTAGKQDTVQQKNKTSKTGVPVKRRARLDRKKVQAPVKQLPKPAEKQ